MQGRSSVVEQRPFKPKVVGSIPTAPTKNLVDKVRVKFRVGRIWSQNSRYLLHCRSLILAATAYVHPRGRSGIAYHKTARVAFADESGNACVVLDQQHPYNSEP
jgi:hypothetical protein